MSDCETLVSDAMHDAEFEKSHTPCTVCLGDGFHPSLWRPCSKWPDCEEDECTLCHYEPCEDCQGTGWIPI